ncbi:flagellar biosynthetic protein FliR [Kordiimonas sp. SCSIO 12610]|uniref:flagellar biosynthetic protein FliR n=1 Tax=Kordiimonas sp. SCSIO 12610 TaxID=2829597 RepID=UPI00210AD816|nr:flagellar biosynthetic protein FliR [Kordiimonas sp. SCSIO 12610]UTW56819.1 flagellar type III secretion system protein FliR [Kordiimonas sp. SCSIO 12610]
MLDSFLPQEIFGVLLVMTRFAPLVMVMPVLGEQSIPRRVRVSFSFLLSIVIYSAVRDQLVALPPTVFELLTLIVREFMVGLIIGLMARVLMASTHVAGTVIAFQTGLASAQQFDPNQGGQSAIVASFMTVTAITLIVVTDLHHLMIMGLVNSYNRFPVDDVIQFADFAGVAIYYVVEAFELGIRLSAPFLIYALVYNLGLGLIARLMPQFQVFFVGMPANVYMGFLLLMLLIGSIMTLFLERVQEYLLQFLG